MRGLFSSFSGKAQVSCHGSWKNPGGFTFGGRRSDLNDPRRKSDCAWQQKEKMPKNLRARWRSEPIAPVGEVGTTQCEMLPFSVHFRPGEPAHEQILAAVREAFATGQLQDGDPFPSVRDLTRELKVSPSTSQRAIDQLIEDGFLSQRRGSGFIIHTGAPARWVSELRSSQDELLAAETVVDNPNQEAMAARFPFLAASENPEVEGLLEDYEIARLIARGGMGMVFEAFDPALMRKVAIKVLIPQLAASPESRTRFLREARSAAAVDHDNVLPVHAVGEYRGFPYLVMPFVDGESLRECLAREGPLPSSELRRIALAAARGLAAAHHRGLVHRDIKPDNVLLETKGDRRVWLADFGLARAANDAGLTHTGALAATPQFASPEQARGDEVDFRSDLFSFGSLLYVMATGSPPFEGADPLAVLRKIVEETPPAPRSKRPDLSASLESLILDLMHKDPNDRPASAAEVAGRLASLDQL